jgi:predicted negative regulator of RcsB-dependent stress response
VDIYNSEQEQVEALKAWWDKNGRTAIAAIVVVLLSVLGWKSWMGHQQQRAVAASASYQQMLDVLDSNPAQAMELGRSVVAEYPDSSYAVMASLAMAKAAVAQKDLDAAAAHLRLAMEQANLDEFKQLARLRLAEVLLAQGKADEALALLPGEAVPSFRGSYAELRGDILLSQGKRDAARDAYSNALAGYQNVPEKRSLVQIKLDDLVENKAE